MLTQILLGLTKAAVLAVILFALMRWLKTIRFKPMPDLPPEGGRIKTGGLSAFQRGKSPVWSIANKQSLGFIELTPGRMRTGSLIQFDVGYEDIERVYTRTSGLQELVIFEFRKEEKSLAATVGHARVAGLLNYLRERSVVVEDSTRTS